MVEYSAGLSALIDAAPDTKAGYSNAIKTGLGNTRRLILAKDGVPFLNVGMTGAMTVGAGHITGFGSATGTTVRTAANLLTGASTLRIEGNGEWMQATLGLSKEAQKALRMAGGMTEAEADDAFVPFDYYLGANPTTTSGIGFAKTAKLKAPEMYDSGVGPGAPDKVASDPHTIELWGGADTASLALISTTTFDTRNKNIVRQDRGMALSSGDVAWWNCSNSLMWGPYEFAPHLYLADKRNTKAGVNPLKSVLIDAAYDDDWVNYPLASGYDRVNHLLSPEAFKVIIKDQNGNVLHTFQEHTGKANNDPSLLSGNLNTPAGTGDIKPLQPKWNIHMSMIWLSETPSFTNECAHMFPPLAEGQYRPTSARSYLAVVGCEPLLTGGAQGWSQNGLGHMFGSTQWPMPRQNYIPTIPDPYFNYQQFSDGEYLGRPWRIGWDYEPGSFSGHNWYTAPGGPRFDRCLVPSVLQMWLTFPDGHRPQDNVPWEDMAMGYIKAYANHSNHFYRDPKRLYLDTNANLLAGKNQLIGQYYGDFEATADAIAINASQSQGPNAGHFDSRGDMIASGWGWDELHASKNTGLVALMVNSPIHAVLAKKDMAYMRMMNKDQGMSVHHYVHRRMAWDWKDWPIMWKLGADHELFFTQEEIEAACEKMLIAMHTNIYVPTYVDNDPSPFFAGIRNLGTPIQVEDNGWRSTPGGLHAFYIGRILKLWKQTGFWDRMMSKGGKVQQMLNMVIENHIKFATGVMIDSPVLNVWNGYFSWPPESHIAFPNDWAHWQTMYGVKDGSTNIRNANGTLHDQGSGSDIENLVVQFLYAMRDCFPEYDMTRVNQAIAIHEADEAAIIAAVNAQPNLVLKVKQDRMYRHPGLMVTAAPAVIGLAPTE